MWLMKRQQLTTVFRVTQNHYDQVAPAVRNRLVLARRSDGAVETTTQQEQQPSRLRL
jgi:hypothetical protein